VSPMRDRHLSAALAGALLVAAVAPPATAAGNGTIRGRVINESTGRPQPDVRVTLTTALDDGSEAAELTAVTDGRGRYVFRRLETGEDRFYAVDARFRRGTFAGGVVSIPSDTARPPVIDTTLRVWDTTTDPAAIVIRRDSIFVVPSDAGVGVIEAVQVTNVADEAYIGRGRSLGAKRDGELASLGFPVPPGALLPPAPIVDSDLDIPSIVETGFGFAATTAIPPGQWRVVYSYGLEGDGGTYDLSRPALYPTLEVGVYAGDPLSIDGNRIAPDGTRDVRGKSYAFYSSDEAMEPGDRLEMVAVAEASSGSIWLAGLAVGAFAAVAAAVFLFARRRPRPVAREDLVEAIARLDLAREQGLVPEEEWGPRREALKRRLEEMPT
jgi:5-hydroxyisourate hydrolase-like protein (transthyretin family)